eukprot:GILK01007884.1.p1 GENE.GILK01007884.1~~GILK01007884.1.p1  ORF type:complete len:681 (+),score=55.24 GILK01007884.1:63-2105(+)
MRCVNVFGTATARYSSVAIRNDTIVDVPIGQCVARWDMKNKQRLSLTQIHSDIVSCIVGANPFSKRRCSEVHDPSPEYIVTASYGGDIAVWSQDWQLLDRSAVPNGRLQDVSLSMDRRKLATCSEAGHNGGLLGTFSIDEEHKLQRGWQREGHFRFSCWNKVGNLYVLSFEEEDMSQYTEHRQPKVLAVHWQIFNGQTGESTAPSLLSTLEVLSIHVNVELGQAVLGHVSRTVSIVNVDSGELISTFKALGSSPLRTVFYHRNSHIFLPSTDGKIYEYSSAGELLNRYVGSDGNCYYLEVLSDTPIVWMCTDSSVICFPLEPIEVYETNTHHQNGADNSSARAGRYEVEFHAMTCCGVDISSDLRYVASGDFMGNVFVWNIRNDAFQPSYSVAVQQPIRSLCWKPNTTKLTIGTIDGRIFEWSLFQDETPPSSSSLKLIAALNDGVTGLRWTDTGESKQILAAGTTGGVLGLFHSELGEDFLRTSTVFVAHPPAKGPQDLRFGSLGKFSEIWSLCWSPDHSHVVTVSEDQRAFVWRLLDMDKVAVLEGHTTAVTCVDWQITSRGELLATCADDQTIRLYNGATYGLVHVFNTTTDNKEWHTITYMALEKNGSRLCCSTQNGFVFLWSIITHELLFCKKLHCGSVEGLRWTSNGQEALLATCSSDCTVAVLSVENSSEKSL